jgi:hypothetical protein
VTSNVEVIMNCARCVHAHTQLIPRFHVIPTFHS